MKTLLFDLTSLDGPGRRRGMGRYLRELAESLAALPSRAKGALRLLGLSHLGLNGSYRVVEDLASFSGSPEVPWPGAADHYRWAYARRVALWRALRATRADAVHLGDPHATPLLMGLTSCRKIVTCHDVIPLRYPERYLGLRDGGRRLGLAIERRRYRSADLVIAISEATRRDVCSLLGVPQHRVVRVYNGVDVARWAAPESARSAKTLARFALTGRPFALYVGGCDWHKNIAGMMRGLAEARSLEPAIELLWAGHLRPDQRRAVDALAREAGVTDGVRHLGYTNEAELKALYRGALAHVLLSHAEGFGLTVVEAMASGCPVVTTSGGSLREIAGDASLRVDPHDHVALGFALARIYREPALRSDLVARGRERARLFSRGVQAHAMLGVYRGFLDV